MGLNRPYQFEDQIELVVHGCGAIAAWDMGLGRAGRSSSSSKITPTSCKNRFAELTSAGPAHVYKTDRLGRGDQSVSSRTTTA